MNERAGVLFVIGNLGVGGVVRVLLNIVNHLPGERPAVVVRVPEGGLLRDLHAGVPLFTLAGRRLTPAERDAAPAGGTRPPRGLRVASLVAFWKEVTGLRRILRETGARAISTFFMRGHLVALIATAAMRRRPRVVVNIHEHLSERAMDDYPRPVERVLMRWMVRHVLSRADVVVAPAGALRDDLIALGVPPARVLVRRNPVDLDAIRRRAAEPVEAWAERRPGRALLVGVGRLIAPKAYHVLVDAMARLPDTVEAIVAGAGPELAALQAQAERLGVGARIRFVGGQENPWRYLARASVFVHPSFSEAQGLVFVEAMALGVPVVATSGSAGIRESLAGGAGQLCEPGDAAALAAAVRRVLDDGALRESLIARGHAAAAAYALPVAVAEYAGVLTPSAGTA